MIDRLRVGHAADPGVKSGVTVVLPDEPAVASVHVAGGAPASRETDLLRPGNLVERVDAIVLAGGSAFGLAAADGVMAWLAERGRGYRVADVRVPIVPAAGLFDLANGGDKSRLSNAPAIYPALGHAACEAAERFVAVGSVGAGTGATTADLKGGFGAAATQLADGTRLAALVAVNAVGRVTLGSTPHFRAAAFEENAEFGGLGLPAPLPSDASEVAIKRRAEPGQSTTLGVVVTDWALTRAEAKRIAIAAHDGIALAIFPAQRRSTATPFSLCRSAPGHVPRGRTISSRSRPPQHRLSPAPLPSRSIRRNRQKAITSPRGASATRKFLPLRPTLRICRPCPSTSDKRPC
jgi:L-aminopeptidase/D-esterase-like protein